MKIDDHEWLKGRIERIREELCNHLKSETIRFPSRGRLLRRFDDASTRLLSQGNNYLSAFREVHNELSIAYCILNNDKGRTCKQVEYEPALSGCDRRIDFCSELATGQTVYVEVKTICPLPQDDWSKYERAVRDGLFPDDAFVHFEKDWLGGELWHNRFAARSKMLGYAIQLEDTLQQCAYSVVNSNVVLAFCGNGFKWHVDELEDFVAFYYSGHHRQDDPFRKMELFDLEQNSVTMTRRIDRFAYFGRRDTNILPERINWDVRPPKDFMG